MEAANASEAPSPPDESQAKMYMALFMASWSIGFVALLLAHLYVRLDAVTWPPADAPTPPRALAGLSSLLVLASSLAYHFGLRGVEAARPRRLVLGLSAAAGLSFLFLLTQLAAAFQALARGLVWNDGVYGGFFWVIAGLHYAHVVVGFTACVWLVLRARGGAYRSDRHLAVRLWGYYWHSIGLIWLIIYLVLFLLG